MISPAGSGPGASLDRTLLSQLDPQSLVSSGSGWVDSDTKRIVIAEHSVLKTKITTYLSWKTTL